MLSVVVLPGDSVGPLTITRMALVASGMALLVPGLLRAPLRIPGRSILASAGRTLSYPVYLWHPLVIFGLAAVGIGGWVAIGLTLVATLVHRGLLVAAGRATDARVPSSPPDARGRARPVVGVPGAPPRLRGVGPLDVLGARGRGVRPAQRDVDNRLSCPDTIPRRWRAMAPTVRHLRRSATRDRPATSRPHRDRSRVSRSSTPRSCSPGPVIGTLLADFGADVIKVEHPKGDALRTLGWQKDGVVAVVGVRQPQQAARVHRLRRARGRGAAQGAGQGRGRAHRVASARAPSSAGAWARMCSTPSTRGW